MNTKNFTAGDKMLSAQDNPVDLAFPPLSSLYFYLTSYCNLNCSHCWIAPTYIKQNEAPKEAPFWLLKDIIDQALPLGLRHIKITGGEPFLNKYIFPLINYAFSKQLNIAIETNATLIDKITAQFLKEHSIKQIAVSLDGPNQEIHEQLRSQEGCFDTTLQGIALLKKHALNVQVIMSLYKGNIDYLEETIALAVSFGVNSFKINHISHIARGESLERKGLILTIRDYIELNTKINEELQPKHKIKIILDIPPAFKKLKNIKEEGRCGIKNILGVLPDGRISICGIGEVLAALVLADIRKDSLEHIWKSNLILKEIRENIPGKLEGVCAKCMFKALCLGKCRAEAFYDTGNMRSPFSFCAEAWRLSLFPEERTFKIKQEANV